MKSFKVTAWITVPTPGVQEWNGASYQNGTRKQFVETVVTASNWFEAKAMVEGQYGSSLANTPAIMEIS